MNRTLLHTLIRFVKQPTHCISSDLTTSILNYSVCYTLPANLPIYSYRPTLSSCTPFLCLCLLLQTLAHSPDHPLSILSPTCPAFLSSRQLIPSDLPSLANLSCCLSQPYLIRPIHTLANLSCCPNLSLSCPSDPLSGKPILLS